MIQSFRDRGTADVYNGVRSKRARRTCPSDLWDVARRKLDMLAVASALHDLRVPPANHLEQLAGNRAGQHSIRINQRYRICFEWAELGPKNVEIVDYH